MHPNPVFRSGDRDRAIDFARERGFGVITLAGPADVMASHVPFVLEEGEIRAHLVRSNPIARLLRDGPREALLIVSGPDAYVSPDWYGEADQVPTWNYVAIHLRGALKLLDEDALLGHLEALSAANERRLAPKTPWTHRKMSAGAMNRMMRQIVPVAMSIREADATWKLNQNKSESARLAAAAMVAHAPAGHDRDVLAALMRTAEAPGDRSKEDGPGHDRARSPARRR